MGHLSQKASVTTFVFERSSEACPYWLVPLKVTQLPETPVVRVGALTSVAVLPFPDESVAVDPELSSSFQTAYGVVVVVAPKSWSWRTVDRGNRASPVWPPRY